jgi:hypothetical protein
VRITGWVRGGEAHLDAEFQHKGGAKLREQRGLNQDGGATGRARESGGDEGGKESVAELRSLRGDCGSNGSWVAFCLTQCTGLRLAHR